MFSIASDSFQIMLSEMGNSAREKEVEVRNDLDEGAINASIYKEGKLLGAKVDPVILTNKNIQWTRST